MNEQIIILISTCFAVFVTLWLYIWRAIKQVQYKNDERWILVLLKAKNIAEISNWILVVLLGILILIPSIQEISFSLRRIIFGCLLYFGIHNFFELIGLIYYNHKL